MSGPGGGPQGPGDTLVFWWPAGTDPDTYDANHGRAMDMAVARYAEFYGEAPEAEIVGEARDGERGRGGTISSIAGRDRLQNVDDR